MVNQLSEQECVLCGSCIASCPTKAIGFKRRYRDFLYPEIEMGKCINCNKCDKVCPIINPPTPNKQVICEGYIARNRHRDIRIASTSGGIFSAAADYILSHGGYVCGAVLDVFFHVSHICSNSEAIIAKMRGSKYVQSNMVSAFNEIKSKLSSGVLVLFTGCPCQVAAVQSYLGGKPENLILIELICHGVPSDNMLQSYIHLHEQSAQSKAKTIEFRRKTVGWHNSIIRIDFENGRVFQKSTYEDVFMKGFLSGVYLKESCYQCQFRNFKSCADIILGDFWGAEVEFPELDDNTGLSAVIALSEKGSKLLSEICIEKYKVDIRKIIKYNKNIVESCPPNPLRNVFYKTSSKKGYEYALKKHLKDSIYHVMYRRLRVYVRKFKNLIHEWILKRYNEDYN